jgi:hypothetical protein
MARLRSLFAVLALTAVSVFAVAIDVARRWMP